MGLLLVYLLIVSFGLSFLLGVPVILTHEMFLRNSNFGNRTVFWITPAITTPLVIAALAYEMECCIDDQADGFTTMARDAVVLGLTPALSLCIGLIASLLFKQEEKKVHKDRHRDARRMRLK